MDEQMNMQTGRPSSGKFIFLIIILAAVLVLMVVFGLLQYQSNTQLNQSLNTISTQLQQLDQNQEELAMEIRSEEEPVVVQEDQSPTFVQFVLSALSTWEQDRTAVQPGAPAGMDRLAIFAVSSCTPDNQELCLLPAVLYGPSDWDKAGDQEFYIGLIGGEPVYMGPFTGPLQEYVQDARRLAEIYTYERSVQ